MINEPQAPRIFYIYKIINKINKKIYFGKTSGPNPEIRFYNHLKMAYYKSTKNDCPKLYRSIRKYGSENFSFEILGIFDNENEAYNEEAELILKYNSIKYGLNTIPGGPGSMSGIHNPMYGKGYLIAGSKNGMYGRSGNLNPFYGKKHSKTFINKIKLQNRILSDDNVRDIRIMIENHINYKEIANKYKISFATISRIKSRERYGDIN